ncbi:MAG: hypothetical protein GTN40_05690 [Candidatus Aenigmarchaeota archaeon]|nr:hypothetical protein [Candidatus Aenigmarchaeota archaeon]
MFEQLFGSKTRVKLLNLFFTNPNRSFYVREITRTINEQINSVRRELENLKKLNLVRNKEKAHKLYYSLNPKFKFTDEFKKIFNRIEKVDREIVEEAASATSEEKLAKEFKKIGKVSYASLGGYYVQNPHSEIDIFIVGKVDRRPLKKLITRLETEAGRELNYCLITQEEFNYRQMLYDRFLTEILNSPKIILIDELEPEVKISPKAEKQS